MIIALPKWAWKNIFQLTDSPQRHKSCLLKVLVLFLILSVVKTDDGGQGFSFVEDGCPENQEVVSVRTDFSSQIVKNGRKLLNFFSIAVILFIIFHFSFQNLL